MTPVPISSMLEPSWAKMKKTEESRLQMLGNWHSSSDPWADIRRAHPRQCAFRPTVHRNIILVAEKEDADDPEGMSLVRLKWDGNTDGVEDASPALMPEVEILGKMSAGKALEEADRAAQ
ncbi:hypothetical protein J4E81_007371 [Alternaria sp. BMP 2799]|nr:hypothetical protein J4E81_007371 [Alternaria sp. BMP 2799]